ncbi:hypothetical protein [Haloferula sp. A504]|uniref:hypothetical protein n=1 Tax=Haloferula sp. A504 TaxID=3373601 RepID=UPI0031BCDA3D|nr:hypothetical protein [Verrucomicrobiaceae bacterium E54]
MNREPEIDPKDPLWDLLRQSPRHQAGPRFVDDTVRAARLAGSQQPWWRRVWVPLSLGGLATAATAAVAIFVISQQQDAQEAPALVGTTPPATETLDVLDDMVRTEALLIAADYPSEFTDAELVSLITY